MKYFIALLLLTLLSISSHAEIYKGIDAEGNVIYTDEETPNTTEIQVPEGTSIPMPKPQPRPLPELDVKKDDEEKKSYTVFKIIKPDNDEVLRISSGNVPVTLSVKPELDTNLGHTISVYMDGVAHINKATTLSHQITNVRRGGHTLHAEIKDASGQILKTSNSVKFRMKRHSVQHKNPRGALPGPKKADNTPYKAGPQGVIFQSGPILQLPES